MKYMYRTHRGALADAMKEAKEFDSLDALLDYAALSGVDDVYGVLYTRDDLTLGEWETDDHRIGWYKCRYVVSHRYGLSRMNHVIGTMGIVYDAVELHKLHDLIDAVHKYAKTPEERSELINMMGLYMSLPEEGRRILMNAVLSANMNNKNLYK